MNQLSAAKRPILQMAVYVLMFMSWFAPVSAESEANEVIEAKLADVEWLASQSNVINAVISHNAKELSQDLIKYRDLEWTSTQTVTPLKQDVVYGALGNFLRGMVGTGKVFNEFIVTDKRGVNVACFPETTDYWQGDEEKWILAFNQGKGANFIGTAEFDQSTQTQAVQVAVPIRHQNKVIGVLIAGIQMNFIEYKLAKRKLASKKVPKPHIN